MKTEIVDNYKETHGDKNNHNEIDEYIINQIIQVRRKSGEKINRMIKGKFSYFIYIIGHITKMHFRYEFIKQRILMERNESTEKINKFFHNYKYHFQIKKLLNKKESCCCLFTSIIEKDLQLVIYNETSKNKQIKTYKFEYSPIFNKYVAYIPHSDIKRLVVYAHILSKNGKVLVDPLYNSKYENKEYFNIINFNKILNEEKEIRANNKKLLAPYIKKHMEYIKSISKSSKNLISLKYNLVNKNNLSLNNISEDIKPILKSRPLLRMRSNKRLSFGKIDFCS